MDAAAAKTERDAQAMTRDEMIEQSRRRAEELRADLERRAAARAADPAAMQDWLLANAEPIRRPPMRETNQLGLITKDFPVERQTASAEPAAAPLSEEERQELVKWLHRLRDQFPIERERIYNAVARAMDMMAKHERAVRDERINVLEAEVVELKRAIREAAVDLPNWRRHE